MRAFRLWLANKVAPKGVAISTWDLARTPVKAPTPLWLNRRQAMLQFGYDPRDTANP